MTGRKILVRSPQWLGDAVVSTVFLQRLKIKEKDSEITVLAPESVAEVFKSHPSVSDIITIEKRHRHPWRVAEKLKTRGFDSAYILPRSFRTVMEIWMAGIPARVGFGGGLRRFFLTNAVAYDPNLLYAHRYLKLIDEHTMSIDQTPPYFPTLDPKRLDSETLLDGLLRGAERPLLGMAPASVAPARTWDPRRFAAVANAFQAERGGTVVLFGSHREKEATLAVKTEVKGPVIDTAGQLNLPELGWVLQNCDVLVANDSGIMHVASAFRVPTVVLFGPSEPRWALPPWGHFIAIQHSEVACVPCLKNECVRFGDFKYECLKAITVDEVISAIKKAIKHS